ncbi:MAG: hypothetical protein JSU74_08450 [Candidatus Zixiibacteriota bacterium]|nr:MAG: hypothetical protein JSU74_08450 [candidate division Zixibacteria bacterium]
MKTRAFLLGFYSIGGQVLLLRELVASLNGDELFISTALFGWLLAVAVGAYIGGKPNIRTEPVVLFAIGALVLPATILLIRISPGATGYLVGEVIPFVKAALISMVLMLPVGFLSGWLFPSIASDEARVRGSIIDVYLFEGIGAFAGGLAILFFVGSFVSAMQAAIAIGIAVLTVSLVLFSSRWFVRIPLAVAGAALIWFGLPLTPPVEESLSDFRYEPFVVEASFDTHYGRQAILSREGDVILHTDNTVEAVYPDLNNAEDLIIPPLAYCPGAENILYVGRAEFGVSQLADSLGLTLVAVDLRAELSRAVDEVLNPSQRLKRVHRDLFTYDASSSGEPGNFDVVILNPGSPDSYRASRFYTPFAMRLVRSLLNPGGILLIPTSYDTDRYVGVEEQRLLSTIMNVVRKEFAFTDAWPGNRTLILASDSSLFYIPYDTIAARIDSLPYRPYFVSDSYLVDRLSILKKERLYDAMNRLEDINSIEKPLLPHYQALLRAKADAVDSTVITQVVTRPWYSLVVPAIVVLLFLGTIGSRRSRGRFALFLFFVAGFISLSLELISFYVYQASSGSLYTEIAVLIGAFMLGLAVGTYLALRLERNDTAHIALFVLFVLAIVFLITYAIVPAWLTIFYHTLFLLLAATATGALFVAATRRYYGEQSMVNRGLGYALEIAGSSIGALFSTTVLLPMIGLAWLLIGIAAVAGLAYAGLLIAR